MYVATKLVQLSRCMHCYSLVISLFCIGMNSIMVYCGSELLQDYFPFSWRHNNETHFSLLSSNVVAVGLWILIAYYCYRLKFFVKI